MPQTPGRLVESKTIQPHHFGFGTLRAGQTLRIVDVDDGEAEIHDRGDRP